MFAGIQVSNAPSFEWWDLWAVYSWQDDQSVEDPGCLHKIDIGCRCLNFLLEILGEEQTMELWEGSPDWNLQQLVQGFDASTVLATLVERELWDAAITWVLRSFDLYLPQIDPTFGCTQCRELRDRC